MLAQSPATFRVNSGATFPATAGESAPPVKKSAARRILIVDDEPLVRWAIAETLSHCGYDVDEANDAESTVRTLFEAGAGPDVVLLDLRLPDSKDLKLLETVRRMAPRATVILMTAFGTPEVRDEALHLGAAAVLDKPFNIDSLDGLISRSLGNLQ